MTADQSADFLGTALAAGAARCERAGRLADARPRRPAPSTGSPGAATSSPRA